MLQKYCKDSLALKLLRDYLTISSQESEGGLYVDLNTFIGVCADHLPLHFERTSNPVYLNIIRTKTLKPVCKETPSSRSPSSPMTFKVENKDTDPHKRKAVVLGIGEDHGDFFLFFLSACLTSALNRSRRRIRSRG